MIPDSIKKLIEAHKKTNEWFNFQKSLRPLNVSKVAKLAGGTYESVRNSVELDYDHLLRRRAIKRILLRMKSLKGGDPTHMAEDLLKEIAWGKYMKGIPLAEMSIEKVGKTIQKYQALSYIYYEKRGSKISNSQAQDLYDILSFEIERSIYPYFIQDSLINIQYFNLKDLGLTRSPGLNDKYESIQTYINVAKSVNKFDLGMIKFYMFKNAFPFWEKATKQDLDNVVSKLERALDEINSHLNYKIKNKKFKDFVKQAIPLKILNDTIANNLDDAESILDDKPKRVEAIIAQCNKEYSSIRKKIRTSVIKSVIYLAATKMIFAVAIELPYELYIMQHDELKYFIPLIINIIASPVLMAIIASSFSIPEKRNTEAIVEMTDRLMNPLKEKLGNKGIARNRKRPVLYFIFRVFSNVIFFTVLGGMSYLLYTYANFNWLSITIFILFLSLISFAALKVRNIATELIVVPIRGNILTPFMDTIALPILGLGKLLSDGVSKLSPIPIFLDYVVETPFKGFIRIFDEWNSYVKDQREEIV